MHANPFALRILPAADAVICAGDLVDYGPDPISTIDWVRTSEATVVQGNHDFALATGADCGVLSALREASIRTRSVHRHRLSEEHLAYLRDLPRVTTVTHAGTTFALTHAAPEDLCRYLPAHEAARLLASRFPQAQVLVLGHTHEQTHFEQDGRTVINPGSVGLSRVGGSAQYAVWEDGEVSTFTQPYDVEATVELLAHFPLDPVTYDVLVGTLRQGRIPTVESTSS
jgi:predicted phosphodiesterase